jgi:predicted ATPase
MRHLERRCFRWAQSPSYHSAKAVDYAGNLAQLIGAQLTLLHFYDESSRQITVPGVQGYESMLEQERTAKNNLYALRDEIRKKSVGRAPARPYRSV